MAHVIDRGRQPPADRVGSCRSPPQTHSLKQRLKPRIKPGLHPPLLSLPKSSSSTARSRRPDGGSSVGEAWLFRFPSDAFNHTSLECPASSNLNHFHFLLDRAHSNVVLYPYYQISSGSSLKQSRVREGIGGMTSLNTHPVLSTFPRQLLGNQSNANSRGASTSSNCPPPLGLPIFTFIFMRRRRR